MGRIFRVGLTGNIASGKSTVVEVWRALGAHVIDADVLAREAIAPGSPGHARVLEAFGTVDRAELRHIVFSDDARRKLLESIIHPEVARLRDLAEQEVRARGGSIVVNDIPLLFEAGLAQEFDCVVLVDSPAAERVRRIVENRGIERAEAERMVAAQMPSGSKRELADIVIDNSGSLEALRLQAENTWRAVEARAADHHG